MGFSRVTIAMDLTNTLVAFKNTIKNLFINMLYKGLVVFLNSKIIYSISLY